MPPKTELEPIKDSITEQREIIDKHTDQLAKIERQLQLLRSRKLFFLRRPSEEGTTRLVVKSPTETTTASLDKYTLTLVISGLLVIFLLLYVLVSPREYEEQLWK
jgi:predicted PurR-regulated permease PerM